MMKQLRSISISHKTASLELRESYLLSDSTRMALNNKILSSFDDVSGLMIISTCNRTEIYFESSSTSANELLDYLILFINPDHHQENQRHLFEVHDSTINAAQHLLYVANGLSSAVLGDNQIISQVKQAFWFALEHKTQGSVLERAMQATFRSHKRIVNETSFHSGSTSTAYMALKLIEEGLGKSNLSNQKLLIIGAGQISTEVLQYLPKFPFSEVYISNRTLEKAEKLANTYGIKMYAWDNVKKNDFSEFDAVISAVSNRKDLIKTVQKSKQSKVMVDLAFPANINPLIGKQENVSVFNLDDLNSQSELTSLERTNATSSVHEIIESEILILENWMRQHQLRKFSHLFCQTQSTLQQFTYNDSQNSLVQARLTK
ncbi:glutamyl-tRNA reductase [Limibacter armeniacum]|uniref:glutamyl-tRNA reductase n=1 Tax=Limibacter armeniacum TaxID=466084 RepID=UPI002FE61D84